MKIISTEKKEEALQLFFDATNQANPRVQMGVITLQPGQRQPEAGMACHEQDEYSYVISGEAHTILEDGQDLLGKAGDAQWIEAGEKHVNYNDGKEPAVVVWMLVERE